MFFTNNYMKVLNGKDVEAFIKNQKSQMELIANLIEAKYPPCSNCGKRIVQGDVELELCKLCIQKSDEMAEKHELDVIDTDPTTSAQEE